MRAAVTSAIGGPIAVSDIPDPVRRSGEVLVAVQAASVNRLDRFVYDRGTGPGGPVTFPCVQGIDAAGVIEWGSGSLATGLRVVVKPSIACRRCRWCKANRWADCTESTSFGIDRQGGFAELLAVPRSNIIRLPDSVSFVAGAAAAHVHPVVLRMIRAAGELPPDAVTMVTGAGGALGGAAVQLLTALGHRVIAVASSDHKLLAARDLGALVGLNHATGNLVDDVMVTTGGAGVDLVIETTGSAGIVSASLASLGRGGALVVVAAPPATPLDLDVFDVYRSRHRIIGSANSNHSDFIEAFRMLDEHGIEPVISAAFDLGRAAEAMDAVVDRERIGKVVIEIGANQ